MNHLPKNIADKIEVGDCWHWTGATTYGYGRISKRTYGMQLAHRYVYTILVGPIPEGKELHHLCINPGCVNPDHLQVVDPVDNNRARPHRPNQHSDKEHCKHGHEFTPENTYIRPCGGRTCKTCHRETKRRYESRKRVIS